MLLLTLGCRFSGVTTVDDVSRRKNLAERGPLTNIQKKSGEIIMNPDVVVHCILKPSKKRKNQQSTEN